QISSSQSNFNISLESDVLIGQEVVVSASRKREKIQEAPAAVSVLPLEKIANDAVVNPMLSIRNLTAVNVSQYGVGGGQINLRGRSAVFQTESFIMADYRNIVLPGLGALQYEQQPIDAIDLERVEVIRGPGSALYGPGVEAGIVHFISKDPFRYPGTAVSVYGGNQSSFGASLRHAGHTKDEKLGYKITGYFRSAQDFEIESDSTVDPVQAARLASFPDQIVSAVNPENVITTEIPNYDMRSYGFTATLEYRLSDKTSITGLGGVGVGEAIFRTSQGEGYTTASRPFAQVRVQSGGFFGQAFWSYQNGADGNSFLYATGLTTINEAHQFETQLQYTVQAFKNKLDITVGADYRLNTIETEGSIHGRFEDDDDYAIFGAYAQVDVKATNKLNIIAAGRVDRFSALDEVAFSPRVGLV
ncbi:MAG: TonB-dependent receptor, partial [Bacteroidota bacterium]